MTRWSVFPTRRAPVAGYTRTHRHPLTAAISIIFAILTTNLCRSARGAILFQELKGQSDRLHDEVFASKKDSMESESFTFLPPAASCSQSGSVDDHTCGMALDRNVSTYSQTSDAYPSVGSWYFVDLGYPILMDSIRLWVPNITESKTNKSGLAMRTVAPVPFVITFLNSSDNFANMPISLSNSRLHDSVRVTSAFQSNINVRLYQQRARAVFIQMISRKDEPQAGTLLLSELEIFVDLSYCRSNCSYRGRCSRRLNTKALQVGKGMSSSNFTCVCDGGWNGIACGSLSLPELAPFENTNRLRHSGHSSQESPYPHMDRNFPLGWIIAASIGGSFGTCLCGLFFVLLCKRDSCLYGTAAAVRDEGSIGKLHTVELGGEKQYKNEEAFCSQTVHRERIQVSSAVPVAMAQTVPHQPYVAYLFASPLVHVHRRHSSWSDSSSISFPTIHTSNLPAVMTATPIIDQLDVEKEFQCLNHAVRRSQAYGLTEYSLSSPSARVHKMAATLENLQGVLESRAKDIIHISCHCTSDDFDSSQPEISVPEGLNGSKLLFEDAYSASHPINSHTINRIFLQHNRNTRVKLVVIMACNSQFIASELSNVVKYTIGTVGKISDSVAAFFTQSLYLSLNTDCQSISQAFHKAKESIRESPQFYHAEAEQFVLYCNGLPYKQNAGDANSNFQDPSLNAAYVEETRLNRMKEFHSRNGIVHNNLPALGEDFVGREVDVYRIMRSIGRRRFVIVCPSAKYCKQEGPGMSASGLGCSSIVLAGAHRLHERSHGCSPSAQWCKDGVIFIQGASSISQICEQWIDQLRRLRSCAESYDLGTLNNGAPPIISAERMPSAKITSTYSKDDVNNRHGGQNTPVIVKLMRIARLNPNLLVVIDNCTMDLMSSSTSTGTCLHNFLCGLLQSLPKLRILMSSNKSPYAMTCFHNGGALMQRYEQTNHSFKPMLVEINGLSRVASARLLLRRAHRPITVEEALYAGTDQNFDKSCCKQKIIKALSQHPIIEKTKGNPCEISRLALRITKDLPSINLLLSDKKGSQ